jgi:hypothetical protein
MPAEQPIQTPFEIDPTQKYFRLVGLRSNQETQTVHADFFFDAMGRNMGSIFRISSGDPTKLTQVNWLVYQGQKSSYVYDIPYEQELYNRETNENRYTNLPITAVGAFIERVGEVVQHVGGIEHLTEQAIFEDVGIKKLFEV